MLRTVLNQLRSSLNKVRSSNTVVGIPTNGVSLRYEVVNACTAARCFVIKRPIR